jgi:acylphosphatase
MTIHLKIRGRVQGVSFRWFTRVAACELGLAGRVRNLADGSVEVEVAGDPAALEELVARLREGPPGSRVSGIERRELSGAAAEIRAEDGFIIDR